MPYIGNAPYQGSVAGTNIIDGTIDTLDLKDGSVTSAKLETIAGLTSGSYGTSSAIPAITLDTKGRVTAISTNAISIPSGSISVTGGDITMSGTTGTAITNATLANSGVTAGTYTKITTDAKGRVTSGATLSSGDLPTYTGTLTSSQITTALTFTPENSANRAQANGYASLDATGKVPSTQLPSYVDDVLEYTNLATFPATGSSGIIYVTQDTNKTYRWTGSAYVEISASPGTTDSLTEGSTNLYYTNARARGSLSFTSGSGAYNSTTGVITIPTNNNQLTNGSGYLTGNQTVTLSGDVSGSGSTAITVTLANSGVTAGTYNNVTVNSKGLITGGSNTSYLTGNQTVTLSGDVSGSGSTAITVTLATVGINKGGTGLTSTPANGALDIGNGSGFTRTTLTAGTGITITNGSGSITIASSGSLPSQTGNSGKYLFTNGTTSSWEFAQLPPTAATNVTAGATSTTEILVTFTQGLYGTQNRIYYSTTSPVTTSSSYVVADTSSGSITGLSTNTTYYIAVGTNSSISTVLSSQIATSTPPSGTTVYTSGQSLNVSAAGTSATFMAGSGVTSMKVELGGGGGGGGGSWNYAGGYGGSGATVAGIYNLSAGRVFTYYVGGGGSAGCNYNGAGDGGGASAVILYGGSPIAVAGGGGGGSSGWNSAPGNAGAGGTLVNTAGPATSNGANGASSSGANTGGGGGTGSANGSGANGGANGSGTAGGQGSVFGSTTTSTGGGGSSGYGAGGLGSRGSGNYPAGGGGGGGYYGGGGGGGTSYIHTNGGGGSSYLASGMSATTASISGGNGGTSSFVNGGSCGTNGGAGTVKITFI